MGESVFFTWETPKEADKYVVSTYLNKVMASTDTVKINSAKVRFYSPGINEYTWYVTALNKSGKKLERLQGKDFEVEVTTKYTPKDMEYTETNEGILLTWSGKSKIAYLLEIKRDGKTLYEEEYTTDKEFLIPASKAQAGKYVWSLTAMNPIMTLTISDAVTLKFTIEEKEGIDDIEDNTTTGKYVQNGQFFIIRNGKMYDVLGR